MADQIPDSAKCGASPDHGDDWRKQGYSTALAEVRDMANVGRALMTAIADNAGSPPLNGWHPADCPSEIVSDLLNMLDDATRAAPPAMDREAEEKAFRQWWDNDRDPDASFPDREAFAFGYQAALSARPPLIGIDHEAVRAALQRSYEGWSNIIEMGIIPPQHRNNARQIADQCHEALSTLSADAIRQGEDRYANDAAAKALYDSWWDQPGWVPWVDRGNSTMQERARREVML